MARALIALGSNLGDRAATLDAAVAALAKLPATRLVRRSAWHASAPVGGPPGQEDFLNGAATIETGLQPLDLLDHLQEIETLAGRRREIRWGPRTLDLDLLIYDEQVIAHKRLSVPHPRLIYRRFVLEPAAEIAGDWPHPTDGRTVAELLDHLNSTPRYLAFAGLPGSGKTRLAQDVAGKNGCRLLLDSAGPRTAGEIELLARRVELLATKLQVEAAAWAISDFWLPQSLAWAEVRGDQVLRSQVETALAATSAEAPSARFVAALDLGGVGEDTLKSDERRGDNEHGPLRSALRRLLTQRGSPPVIWLSSGDWPGAVAELSAVVAD
jgi:2-amino-4-hydroxy-6-hydroxymethyldihydropteridine diphosphokinase